MQMQRTRSLLLLVDFQQRLIPSIRNAESAVEEAAWLAGVASHLQVPVAITEQQPDKIGSTDPRILDAVDADTAKPWAKVHFGAHKEPAIDAALRQSGRTQIIVCGTEAHICVLQTAMGLMAAGYQVFWVSDATASRRHEDAVLARQRFCALGGTAVTADMVAYEWLGRCDTPAFRTLHQNYLKPRATRHVLFS